MLPTSTHGNGRTIQRGVRLGICLVLLATAAAYFPALRGPQLFDDPFVIEGNPSIRQIWPLSVPLQPPAQIPTSGRPVANYTFALNYWLNDHAGVDQRPDPDGPQKTISYHVVNLLLHLASGLLLFGIIRRTLASSPATERWRARADPTALLVTALWLLHPLQTDAVAYITQRTELLAALCYLATLYCSIRAWDDSATRVPVRWYAAGAIVCLLGMGSKEIMVSAPLMVVLYDRAFRLTSWRDLATPACRGRRGFYAALAATLVLLFALVASGARNGTVSFRGPIPWWEYLHSQGWAITRYLRLAFMPTALSLDYGTDPIPHWRGVPGLILLTGLGIGTIIAWTRVRRWGWLAFLGSWFFLILAPSSSVLPIVSEIAAERRFYLPLAAVIVVVVVAIDALVRKVNQHDAVHPARFGAIARAGAIVVLAVLAVVTFDRSRLFSDPIAIWRDATRHVPGNARGWNNLGVILSDVTVRQLDEADIAYRHAIAIDSEYTDARINLILDLLRRRDYPAVTLELRRMPVTSDNEPALEGFGGMVLAGGDTVGALAVLERAAVNSMNADLNVELAKLYRATGRPDDAAAALKRAAALARFH